MIRKVLTFNLLIIFPIICFAGRVEGPGISSAHIPPHGFFHFVLDLKTKEPAIFNCEGVGGEVNYYINDITGKIIAKDEESGSNCLIIFTPNKYGLHALKLVNSSNEASYIFVRVN